MGTLPILQADDRLLQDAKDEKELGELIRVYKDQENELYELRARLARFMTKGAPLLPLATPSARGKVEAAKKKALTKSTRSSSKGSADDSQKGSVPKTIVEPSQAPSSKKADGSSPPLLSTGAKAKRPKTSGGGAAGVGASVKRTTSEMKNDLAPKTK